MKDDISTGSVPVERFENRLRTRPDASDNRNGEIVDRETKE